MNGTGVSDSTENVTLPHWQEPASLVLRFDLGFRVGMGTVCGGW
jgi:hypothetical protein